MGRRKILRCTFLHTSKSHSAAPGMHAYSARKLRAKMHVVTSALQLLTCIFFRGGQANPIQSKSSQLPMLTSYEVILFFYYFSTYCTHENSIVDFMTTL